MLVCPQLWPQNTGRQLYFEWPSLSATLASVSFSMAASCCTLTCSEPSKPYTRVCDEVYLWNARFRNAGISCCCQENSWRPALRTKEHLTAAVSISAMYMQDSLHAQNGSLHGTSSMITTLHVHGRKQTVAVTCSFVLAVGWHFNTFHTFTEAIQHDNR